MKPIISPVIHILNVEQVRTNINICKNANINHIFLINHVTDVPDLINCTLKMKDEFPRYVDRYEPTWLLFRRSSKY